VIKDIEQIREYLHKVMAHADHHAKKAYAIATTLQSWIIAYSDSPEFKARKGVRHNTGNVAYATIGGVDYSFNYDHTSESIKAYRRVSMVNIPVAEFKDTMTLKEIEMKFEELKALKNELRDKYYGNVIELR
jgi:hypothetical protein